MVYLVIGSSGTLGQALIKKLSENKDSSVLAVLHRSISNDLLRKPNIHYYENIDVNDRKALEHFFSGLKQIPESIFYCAGVTQSFDFAKDNLEEWDKVFNTNFGGAVNVCHFASKVMIENELKGSITLVGSGYGERHIPYLSSYCVSKGAMVSLVKTLSTELALNNIRINIVTPGLFPSKMTKPFIANKKYVDQLMKHIPDGKLGTAEDLADVIIFLSSDSAKHINGANIIFDGGMLNLLEGGIVR